LAASRNEHSLDCLLCRARNLQFLADGQNIFAAQRKFHLFVAADRFHLRTQILKLTLLLCQPLAGFGYRKLMVMSAYNSDKMSFRHSLWDTNSQGTQLVQIA